MEVVLVVTMALIPMCVQLVMAYVMALSGLIWAPFAALITWNLARRRQLDGVRYALAGLASSVLLLVPWLLLLSAQRKGVSDSSVRLSYVLLHLGWLLGPIMIWGQHVAELEFLVTLGLHISGGSESDLPILNYGVLGAMFAMWAVSAILTLKRWDSVYDVTDRELMTFGHLLPFALAWACTLFVQGYILLFAE